jgi:hypothetical protein
MIVNYNKAGVWIIQHGKMVNAPMDAEGKQTQQKVFSGQGIKLIPGLNTIKDEVWADISKYPDVAQAIEDGDLEIIENKSEASGKKGAPAASDTIESLEKYDQKKAISIIGGQMEADILVSWKRKEKRPMVLKAIKDQLAKVKAADSAFDNKE